MHIHIQLLAVDLKLEKDKMHLNAGSHLLMRAVIQFAGYDSLWLCNLSEPGARSETALIMNNISAEGL